MLLMVIFWKNWFRLDSTAVLIFVVILVELTNTVFVNSTNISSNIETAVLSSLLGRKRHKMIWYGLIWGVPEVPAVQKKLLPHQNGQNWRSIKETEVKERLPKKSFGPWLKRGVKPLPESFAPSTKLNSVWWKKLYKLPELRAGGGGNSGRKITFLREVIP